MALKPKPAWLNRFTGADMWVTIAPDILYPSTVTDPATPEHRRVVVHEGIHIKQQKNRFVFVTFWFPLYVLFRKLRLKWEAEAVAHEVLAAPLAERRGIMENYATLLSTRYRTLPLGRPPAKSYDHAMAAIVEAARIVAMG